MRSSGLITISLKATRKRSCRSITSDCRLATCRKGRIGSAVAGRNSSYLVMAARELVKFSSLSEGNYVKQHSRNRCRSAAHVESP